MTTICPAYVLLTEAKAVAERSNLPFLRAESRTRLWPSIGGYIDYALFGRWEHGGVFFGTRLKDNAAFEVVAGMRNPRRTATNPRRSTHSPHRRPSPSRLS